MTRVSLRDHWFPYYVAVNAKRNGGPYRTDFIEHVAENIARLTRDPWHAERLIRPRIMPALLWIKSLPTIAHAVDPLQRKDFAIGKTVSPAEIASHEFVYPTSYGGGNYDNISDYLADARRLRDLGDDELWDRKIPPASRHTSRAKVFFWRQQSQVRPAVRPESSQTIAEIFGLLDNELKVLLAIDTYRHAVFVELAREGPGSPNYCIRIYNSGGGLDSYHDRSRQHRWKFDLVYEVTGVKKKPGLNGLNSHEIAKLFTKVPARDVDYLYKWSARKGRKITREGVRYHLCQDGKNCSIEAIHAVLTEFMEVHRYKQLRIINLGLILSECYMEHVQYKTLRFPQDRTFETPKPPPPEHFFCLPRKSNAASGINNNSRPTETTGGRLPYTPEDLVTIVGILHGKIKKFNQKYAQYGRQWFSYLTAV